MKILSLVLVGLVAQGCLVQDDVSKEKRQIANFRWHNEAKQVRYEAETMLDLCIHAGVWQSYGVIDDYLVPHVNWEGKGMTEKIEAHHYIDKTETAEGEPACELNIWIDSLAVRYLEKHGLRCNRPEQGKLFFRLGEFSNETELYFRRKPDGACDDKLFFISGNEDGSLTFVSGQEHSWDLPSPFDENKKIGGHKGQVLSASKYGRLSEKIEDTVVAPVPVKREK